MTFLLVGLITLFGVNDLPQNSLIRVKDNRKITALVGDKICLEHEYSVIPGKIPNKVTIESDSKSVKAIETLRIHLSGPPKVGGATVGGMFHALEKGKATIKLTVESERNTTIIECEVTVK